MAPQQIAFAQHLSGSCRGTTLFKPSDLADGAMPGLHAGDDVDARAPPGETRVRRCVCVESV